MKLDVFDDKYIVYLNKKNIEEIDFKVKKQVEDCFRNLFIKIRKRLNKDISGFFNIKVYLNKDFGAILIIEKEELEYYDYFSNQIDMQIEIEESNVLLEFDDLFSINEKEIYSCNGKFYIKYIDKIEYLEFSKIVYGEEANKIIDNYVIL